MSRIRVFLLPIVLGCFLAGAHAQQPDTPNTSGSGAAAAKALSDDYSAQSAVVLNQRTTYRFEADGTGKKIETVSIRVQSDAGVQQLGQLQLGYAAANQKINIDYLRVRKPDGTVITADNAAVQDMTAPAGRIAPMYTDYREKHVTVPSLRPGDTLEYGTTTETFSPLAANQFWMEHAFTDELIVLDERLVVDVPKSRTVKLKTTDDFKNYETREDGNRRIYTWNYKNLQTRAAREDAEREQGGKKKHKKKSLDEAASVQMTTFSNWEELGKWYSGLETDRRLPSEELKAKAVELTKDLKTDREKVQAVYDYVATNYRYISLSFGVGRFQPHAASEVFKNEYGDCKDKHNLLAAMLQSLGYKVNTVLIHSDHKLDQDVPSPSQFNHVIGNTSIGGETIWMDTTSEIAPIGMLVFQIRDKDALQLASGAGTSIVRTPAKAPFETFSRYELKGEVSELGRLSAHVKHTMRGDSDVAIRGALRRMPRDRWTQVMTFVAAQQGLNGTVTGLTSTELNDTSKPFTFEFDIVVPNFYDWTAKQTRFGLPQESLSMPQLDEQDADPAKLGGPTTLSAHIELKVPDSVTLTAPVPVSIKRDYAEYSSTAKFTDHVLVADRKLVLNALELKPERAADLRSFARVLNSDAEQQIRVDIAAGASANAPKQAKTEELEDAAFKAMQANKLKLAVELYERVTQAEPKHPRAWNNLGRCYMGMMQADKAIAAFNKAIEVNAYDEFAYNNLGRVYEQQQKYSKAIEFYGKQIEVNPLDHFAHTNLGRILLREKKYAEAVPELERAVGITPDDAFALQQLGEAYLKTGQTDKATESFDKALEKAPNPAMWNNVAYTLAEQKQRLDKAQQYAESAVSSTVTLLRNLRPEQAEMAGLGLSASLATYWDTLGWVYFQQGELEKAEKFLRASWEHAEHGEVGYHLGQVYEKRGDKQKAIDIYARSVLASQTVPEARERLTALVGEKSVEKTLNERRNALALARTVELNWPKQDTNGEVLFTFGTTGEPQNVKQLSHASALDSRMAELRGLKFAFSFPDTSTEGFVRKGLVSCSKISGCRVVLLPADATSIGMISQVNEE